MGGTFIRSKHQASTGVIMYDLMSIVSVVLEKIFSIPIRKLAFVLIPFCFGFVHINDVALIFASLVFVFVHTLSKSEKYGALIFP